MAWWSEMKVLIFIADNGWFFMAATVFAVLGAAAYWGM